MVREPIEPIATVVTISIQALRSQDFITFRDAVFVPKKNIQEQTKPKLRFNCMTWTPQVILPKKHEPQKV